MVQREVFSDAGPGDATADRQRLRALLDAAQSFGRLGVWERDRVTGEGYWDPHVFRLFGLPPGERTPHLDEALARIAPSDLAPLCDIYRASLARPGRHEARYKVLRPDGSVGHLHSIWQVPDGDGRIVGVLIDDTESELLGRRHDEASTQLALLSRLVGLSLWRTDLASQRIFRGEQFWNATRLDPGTDGVPVAELRALIHPDDLARVDAASRQALAGDGAAVAEVRLRRPDGSYRRVLSRRMAQRDENGQAVAVLGVGIDITEHPTAGAHYSELRERYELAVSATGTGVWSRDMLTGEREWNLEMHALHGLGPDDRLPAHDDGVLEQVLPEDRPLVRAALDRVWREGQPAADATYRIRRADGAVRVLLDRVRRLADRPQVMIGIVLDVTDLHAVQQAQRDKAAAEASSRAKSEFLSRISHELRTPLNAVLGFSELLQSDREGSLTPRQREWLSQVREAGEHLLGLVDDLLDIGRDAPFPAADPAQRCNLSDVIEQVVLWQGEAARDAGVQISISGDCPQAVGSDRHWRQIVSNLVSNAIKYNHPAGYVQIALRIDADPGWLELEVRDNGRGLSAEQQRQLFEPFNRLGAERSGIEGTGLGLSIVRHLVQSLGGSVAVDSEPGVGTRVRVRAPRADEAAGANERLAPGMPAAAPGSPGPAVAPPPVATLTGPAGDVVYVEDNPVNVLLVREFLSLRPRLRLHVAATVAEGVALVQAVRPQLLLVDLHLPDGSGDELLARLPQRPARHCVALSADVMPDEVARALAHGFDEHWAKPIDLARFLDGVDRLTAAPPGASA